jgi:hypothetical protein
MHLLIWQGGADDEESSSRLSSEYNVDDIEEGDIHIDDRKKSSFQNPVIPEEFEILPKRQTYFSKLKLNNSNNNVIDNNINVNTIINNDHNNSNITNNTPCSQETQESVENQKLHDLSPIDPLAVSESSINQNIVTKNSSSAKKSRKEIGLRVEIEQLRAQYGITDDEQTPVGSETLRDFYSFF